MAVKLMIISNLQLVVEMFSHSTLNKPTNQNSIKVPKVTRQTLAQDFGD